MRTTKQEILEFNRWLKHYKSSLSSEDKFLYKPPKLPFDYFTTLNKMMVDKAPQNKAFQLEWFTPEEVQELIQRTSTLPYKTVGVDTYDLDTPRIYFDMEENATIFFQLYRKFYAEIAYIVELLLGMEVRDIESIFIAKYSPDEFPIDTCHTDDASDVSVVVALNDDYEGGGFELYGGGYYGGKSEFLKPPVGSATIFPGKEKFHRSKTTTEGNRLILVFWCSANYVEMPVPLVPLEQFDIGQVEKVNEEMKVRNKFLLTKERLRQ